MGIYYLGGSGDLSRAHANVYHESTNKSHETSRPILVEPIGVIDTFVQCAAFKGHKNPIICSIYLQLRCYSGSNEFIS